MDLKPKGKPTVGVYALIIIGAAILMMHFALTSIYVFREFAQPGMRSVADKYSFPLFHQGMDLFAPEIPIYNYELESRIAKNGNWSVWSDVTSSAGFSQASVMENAEQSFNHYLAKFVANNFYSKEGVPQFGAIVRSKAYRDALYYAIEMNNKFNAQPDYDSLQIRLNFRFTPLPKSGLSPQYSVLEFPVYVAESVK